MEAIKHVTRIANVMDRRKSKHYPNVRRVSRLHTSRFFDAPVRFSTLSLSRKKHSWFSPFVIL